MPASCWTMDGVGWGQPLSLLQLHSGDWTALWCLLLKLSMVGGEASYHVSLYQLTTLHCVQAGGTDTDCTLFSIIVWVFPYPYIWAKIRYPDFRISINNHKCNYYNSVVRGLRRSLYGRTKTTENGSCQHNAYHVDSRMLSMLLNSWQKSSQHHPL